MSFTRLNVLDGKTMEEGAWLHFLDPRDGTLMYRDGDETLPMRAKVRYSDSKFMEMLQIEYVRNRDQVLGRAKEKDRERIGQELAEEHAIQRFHGNLIALENCGDEPGLVIVDEQMARDLYGDHAMKWMCMDIIIFAGQAKNYGVEKARPTSLAGEAEKPAVPRKRSPKR